MNWFLVLSCMMPSSLVTYSIVVFPLPSLILSYWTVLCCVIMPDLPSCQSCLSARTTWENLGMVLGSITAGVSAMQLCSNSMTLLHIHLGCRYLFSEWCLHSLHFRTSFILIIHVVFFCIGHWMSLVIGLLTTSLQDLKDRADSFRSMQSEARKRHV